MSIMLAVLIVFFCSSASTLSVSAEEVTPSNTYDTAYFQNLFDKDGVEISQINFENLEVNNYSVIMSRRYVSNIIEYQFYFLPKTNNEFYLHNTYSGQTDMLNDYTDLLLKNYPCVYGLDGGIGYTGRGVFHILSTLDSYYYKGTCSISSSSSYISPTQSCISSSNLTSLPSVGTSANVNHTSIATFTTNSYSTNDIYDIYISDAELYNVMLDTGYFSNEIITNFPQKSTIKYVPNLFSNLASIFGGYTGEILDTSVSGLISEKGIDAPSTIYDDYKNKLYYMQNNDLSMVFMNNAEAPSYKKEDYNGIYEGAKKYTFTYAKTYDVIVFFPQYQKYLKFDDWWNANAKGGIDWGAWGNLGIIDVIISTNDKSKTFYLTSDWDVTFNDTGGAAYSGTRVIMSWNSEYGETLDSNTMMKPWEDNSETLKNQGWQEGRPNDMNYPFCIDYYMNGMPTTRIYLNSKPKVEVERISDTKCSYKICMLGTYGYFYDVLSDMYCSFDFTVNYDIENPYGLTFVDIYNDYLEAIHINYISLGDEFQLELWENYKGNDTYYTGTQVFFNWDIRTNWYNSLRDDTFDYNKIIRDSIGGYVDNNGNQHGGNLSDYADSDLNKNNDNGNKQENNSTPSADGFQFTSEGIFAYCGEFFNFIKYIFDLFPAWIWLIIGTFITVLIMLRVLGR